MKNPARVERKLRRRMMLSSLKREHYHRRNTKRFLGLLRNGPLVWVYNRPMDTEKILKSFGADASVTMEQVSMSFTIDL